MRFLFSLLAAISVHAQQPAKAPVHVGWHDEFDRPYEWKHLGVANKPNLDWSKPGLLGLALARVPFDWPYQYQWSGVTKTATIEVLHHPVLVANVTSLSGYAHLDVDVLDEKDKLLVQLRSNTLQAPGVCSINLGEHMFSGTYTFRIRLIVGGPNSGCNATYDWIRVTSVEDRDRLTADPNLPFITEPSSL